MKRISGNLRLEADDGNVAVVFIAAFTARARQEGWNVDDIQVEIETPD